MHPVDMDLLMVIGMKVYVDENPLNSSDVVVVWERVGEDIVTTTAFDIGFRNLATTGSTYWQREMGEAALPPVPNDMWQRKLSIPPDTITAAATAKYWHWYQNGTDKPIVHIPFALITNNMGWVGEPLADFDLDFGVIFFEIYRRLYVSS